MGLWLYRACFAGNGTENRSCMFGLVVGVLDFKVLSHPLNSKQIVDLEPRAKGEVNETFLV